MYGMPMPANATAEFCVKNNRILFAELKTVFLNIDSSNDAIGKCTFSNKTITRQ